MTVMTPEGPVDVHIAVFLVPLAYVAGIWLSLFWFGLTNTFDGDHGMEGWTAVLWPLWVLWRIGERLAVGGIWLRDRSPRLFSILACIGFWLIAPLRPGETGRRIRRFFCRRKDTRK